MEGALYRALVNEAIDEWKIDLKREPDDGFLDPIPTGAPDLHRQVPLLIQAVVKSKLADRDARYKRLIDRLPPVTGPASAVQVSTRFLEVSERAGREQGGQFASAWMNAAMLPDVLTQDYNGWNHRAVYGDIAGWYFAALNLEGWDERVFRDLLDTLKGKEG
ncbi:hypothetical protein [Streptomyces sp. 5-10]|uniref:hypothetical protein n=1 Tax=Streptomyces sp. 5-10 TaxID=878925 RepID=UPI00168C0EA2|nr:hypothetical protein [Streptomyces sp. 5-10]MBD3004639.1 hypothetical protein [Streptomyces sp. 5-10]